MMIEPTVKSTGVRQALQSKTSLLAHAIVQRRPDVVHPSFALSPSRLQSFWR